MSSTPSKASKADKAEAIAANVPSMYTLVAGFATAKSQELRQHLIKTELQSMTLSPGASAYGFVFVPLRGKPASRRQIRLTVPFLRSGSQEVVTIDVSI